MRTSSQREAEALRDHAGIALQHLRDAGADRAEADQADADGRLRGHRLSPRSAQEAADAAHRLADAVHGSRPARSARSPRPSRRSRCPARPRPSPRAACASQNSSEPMALNGSGIGAQTNIVPSGFSIFHCPSPGCASPSISASRRALYSSTVLGHAVLRPAQRDDRADLDRRRDAVVEVALDARRARGSSRGCPPRSRRASPPSSGSSRASRTRSRRPRARHLEDARRLVAVEADLRVREVVHHHQVVLASRTRSGARRRRWSTTCVVGLCRERDDQHLRLRPGALHRGLEVRDEVVIRASSGTWRRSPPAMITEY